MDIVRGLGQRPRWNAAAIALGNFDGVHCGHRALLELATRRARALGGPAIAVTFDPHPTSVLAPHLAPPLLTTMERRLQLLASTGIDLAVVLPFSIELAAMPAADFIEQVLCRDLAARHIVVGYDFSYGQGRGGSTSTLVAHGARAGFGVDVVDPILIDGEIASSTRIRGHLRSGDLGKVRRLLGHAYDLDGVVVHGAKRGRELGFPTANVRPEVELIAALGIYAVRFSVDSASSDSASSDSASSDSASSDSASSDSASSDSASSTTGEARFGPPLPAVASLGTNPTFVDRGDRSLEVFVLDFSDDLYGRRVRVELVEKLRDEAKFDSVQALIAQMHRDVAAARLALERS
jgi:riboflavin kinase / FMN adenylyltransferase